jgi:hypothetical protein
MTIKHINLEMPCKKKKLLGAYFFNNGYRKKKLNEKNKFLSIFNKENPLKCAYGG